jgi:hypothetical protein
MKSNLFTYLKASIVNCEISNPGQCAESKTCSLRNIFIAEMLSVVKALKNHMNLRQS